MKKPNSRSLLLISFLILSAASSGCVSVDLKKPYPDIKTYTLEAIRPSGKAEAAFVGAPVSLKVDRFSATPGASDIFFSYRTDENAYEADFYNQTAAMPAAAVTACVRGWMKEVPFVRFVLDQETGVKTFYQIEGKLLKFYGDYRDEVHPEAVLSLECLIRGYDAGESELLAQKTYEQRVAITSTSPDELVKGWNQGLSRILKALEADLKAAVVKAEKS